MKKYLTDKEIRMFEAYAENYSDRSVNAPISMEDYLRNNWFANKKPIIDAFGGKTIIEKEIDIAANETSIKYLLYGLLAEYENFYQKLQNILIDQFTIDYENSLHTVYVNVWSWFDYFALKENSFYASAYDNYTFIFKSNSTGKKKKVASNKSKPMRVLGWILQNAEVSDEMLAEFDQFRIEHSKIMQTTRIQDTFCLSIHPLDFATMSDNVNSWDSCMSWQENGCYRAGTLEMLSSCYAVVGYLKSSKKNLTFSDPRTGELYEWNSKTWRMIYIITEDFITGIKGYPYQNKELTNIGLEFLREVVAGDYDLAIRESTLKSNGYLNIDEKWNISLITNHMYNDTCYADFNHFILSNKLLTGTSTEYVYNFSGSCSCLNCGEAITHHDTLVCNDCDPNHRCCNCGEYISEDDMFYDESGNAYCEDCWHDIAEDCRWCGDSYYSSDMKNIYFKFKGRVHSGLVCSYCYRNLLNRKQINEEGFVINYNEWQCADIAGAFYLDYNSLLESGIKWK